MANNMWMIGLGDKSIFWVTAKDISGAHDQALAIASDAGRIGLISYFAPLPDAVEDAVPSLPKMLATEPSPTASTESATAQMGSIPNADPLP